MEVSVRLWSSRLRAWLPSLPPLAAPGLKLRSDGAAIVVAALGPLALYALTMPRTVVLEDDGLFLMAGEHLGISHPPGYPLYTFLCWLFMRLPGNPAVLGHLSSAVLGALACATLYACARLLGSGRLAALGAAWLFGASSHFWSQAIIAEVYTLNALAFFASYALILYGVAQFLTFGRRGGGGQNRRSARREATTTWPWVGAAAAFGLGLANHWPLMLLALPGLALAAWPARRALTGVRKLSFLAAAALTCAGVPYLAMVLRSWQEPPVSFYGPIRDWDAFWFYLSRSGYAEADASAAAGWLDRLAYLGWFGKQVLWQLTIPGFALGVLGFAALLRAKRFVDAGSGTLALFGNSVLLILLLGFDYDAYNVSVFRPYSLVCYGIVALWLALGCTALAERLPSAVRNNVHTAPAAIALVCAALVAWNVISGWPANNRAASKVTERHAEHLLALLPERAVLFLHGDTEVGPLGYFRLVEERRPDLEFLSAQGLVFGNRLHEPLASAANKRDALRRFVAASERPIFYAAANEQVPHGRGVRHHGFVKEVRPDAEAGQIDLRFHPSSARYFGDLVRWKPIDGWERRRRNELLFNFGEYLGFVVLAADADLLAKTREARAVAEQSFFSLMRMAEVLLEHGDDADLARVQQWLAKAEPLQGEARTKERRARFMYLNGFLSARLGDMEQAVTAFKASQRHYPHPDNAAIAALKQLRGLRN